MFITLLLPSLTTHAVLLDIIDNLSITILDLISCTILIKVLHTTTPKNNKFLYECTKKTNNPKHKFNILNKVKLLSSIILPIDFVLIFVS